MSLARCNHAEGEAKELGWKNLMASKGHCLAEKPNLVPMPKKKPTSPRVHPGQLRDRLVSQSTHPGILRTAGQFPRSLPILFGRRKEAGLELKSPDYG